MQRWERLVPNKKVGFFFKMFFSLKNVQKLQIFGCNMFTINIFRWEKAVDLEDIFTRQLAQSFVWTQVGILTFFCDKWCFCKGSGVGGNDAIQNHELSTQLQRQNMLIYANAIWTSGDTVARGLSARRCTQGAPEQRLRMTYHAPSTWYLINVNMMNIHRK